MNALIRLLYAVLIAVAVVTFVGVGINSVYPGPKMPEYPVSPAVDTTKEPTSDPGFQKRQNDFDKGYKEFQSKQKEHNKKLSMILVPLAAVIVGFGLWYFKRADVIGEGIALGGAATSVYGIIAASMADHRLMRFAAVVVLLASVILVVQKRFNEPAQKPRKKKA